MRRSREVAKVEPRVRVSLKLVPFGTANYEILGVAREAEAEEREVPRYIGPPATSLKHVIICYEEGKIYSAPKTTADTT